MGLRILWSSNAPWCHTGYGVQAKYILPRLAKMGHETAVFAWYGLEGAMFAINLDGVSIPVYPKHNDSLGRDVIGAHAKHFGADVVVTLMDIWVLPQNFQNVCGCAWAPWFPVDHEPVPPIVRDVAKTATFPMTYSQAGADEMKRQGVRTWYMPMGVDTKMFAPGGKAEARKALGFPADAFIVDMVAANKGYPSRKALSENIEAFARFRQAHTEAFLYLHTEEDQSRGGLDLRALLAALQVPASAFKFVNQYEYNLLGLNDEYMANVYKASDLHLGVATNEGFGIPILEAQACGCPVLTLDFTSMTELTWAGYTLKAEQHTFDLLNSWVGAVSVEAVREGMEQVYNWTAEERAERCAVGVAQAQAYDWDIVTEKHWRPLLEGMEWYLKGER